MAVLIFLVISFFFSLLVLGPGGAITIVAIQGLFFLFTFRSKKA